MAVPTSRTEFREYCLRTLGKPVIKLNLDDDQVEDRIDEALNFFKDYHFDGTHKIYYKYAITETDKTNGYITMPENVLGVVRLYPTSQIMGLNGMFSLRYQFALNDLWTFTSVNMVPYYMTMTHIQQLEQLLVGMPAMRYNRYMNRLYIDGQLKDMAEGEFIICEAYEVVDPEEYTKMWSDRWLQKYTTCLIKQQWGTNLKKFTGMTLPGNIGFSGQKIFDEATTEREALEEEAINTYSLPAAMMIG